MDTPLPALRVLLIEDNPGDALLLRTALDEQAPGAFAITSVERLADALARIAAEPFDAVLCDLCLPDSDGLATAQAIMDRAPALPLVVMTGSHEPHAGSRAIKLGAQDYLVKGESGGALIERTLRYAIERKRLEIQLRTANETLEHRVAERTAELETASRSLRESEARYRSVFAESCVVKLLIDPADGRIVKANSAACDYYGFDPARLQAMNIKDINVLSVDEVQAEMERARTLRKTHFDFRHRLANGEVRDVEVYSSPIPAQGAGGRLLLHSIVIDVTERKQAEEALRASAARHQAVLMTAMDGFWMVDTQGRLLEVNEAYIRMSGYSIEELLSLRISDLEAVETARDTAEHLQKIVGQGEDRFETKHRRKDGSVFDVEVSVQFRSGEDGMFVCFLCDITERKRGEAALRESEARSLAITQSAYEAIITSDSAGNIAGWNRGAEIIFGYTEAQAMGQPMTLLIPERYREGHLAGMHRIRSGAEPRLAGKTVELHGLRQDGSEFPLELTLARWESAGGWFVTGIIGDISERRRQEQSLEESEKRFRGLIEQSLTGIYITQDGVFLYANPRLEQMLGYGAGELVGLRIDDLALAEDLPILQTEREKLCVGATSISYEARVRRKDGAVIELGVQGRLATFEDRPATIGMAQDITEKKRAAAEIKRYVAELEAALMGTVDVTMSMIALRDPYTAGHEQRVAEIAVAIGAELGFDARRQEGLRVAGHLHDVGKITIPAEILSKPGKLSAIEFQLIQGHAQSGYDVLKSVKFPWPVAEVALQHHERIDGGGYPQGLKGEAILLEARIMAVADVIEAMSSHRPYRPGLGIDNALGEIERGRGSAYDPIVADACLKLFREKGYAIPV
ncbi:hypothetical protein CLG94_10410 [Candidatus Methylomirabilis limnetica]|uniref:PAS domain S-box protein n=1 Tax=Candidatus Methylomirabilis limnetica TaxID=2033718 RepID=A0A2T4TW19_9BACT|nr:PAS domain S-box protein [Candidatus Methylomirabilis limnetica]PTL35310.1 hypothetical protein CLG94_10410 [Candidatus Methylomirabilis limnetica]